MWQVQGPFWGWAVSSALIGIRRKGGSNMFRHQISTLGILLDYKLTDPVLLKASVIHDLFEDAPTLPGVTEAEIAGIDADGPAVFALLKPSLAPFALFGANRRSWWVALAVLVAASVPFGGLWAEQHEWPVVLEAQARDERHRGRRQQDKRDTHERRMALTEPRQH